MQKLSKTKLRKIDTLFKSFSDLFITKCTFENNWDTMNLELSNFNECGNKQSWTLTLHQTFAIDIIEKNINPLGKSIESITSPAYSPEILIVLSDDTMIWSCRTVKPREMDDSEKVWWTAKGPNGEEFEMWHTIV